MKKKILIVDDDPDIRLFLAFGLKKAGFEILQAANGGRALDLLKEQTPDLIITDAMMPVLDGYGMIQAVKKETAWSRIPLIMLTGQDSEKTVAGAIQPEMYMKKPFTTEAILTEIKELLTNT